MAEEKQVKNEEKSKVVKQATPASTAPQAPAGIFNKTPKMESISNPVRVSIVKACIDAYAQNGGRNHRLDVARGAYKEFVNGVEQLQTLTGADLRECLSYLIEKIDGAKNGAFDYDMVFRFLPEVAKKGVFERTSRIVNMAMFFAKNDNTRFHQMVDIDYSVALVTSREVRDQIAAYFNV